MTQYRPSNLLVTGGAGFIGRHFIRYWQKKYPSSFIVNLDLLTYAASEASVNHLPHAERYLFVHDDIGNQPLVEALLRQHSINTVVHFAAESHVDNSIKAPSVFMKTNVLGTHALLESVRQVWLQEKKWDASQCRFHHISTDEVYGSLTREAPSFTESTAYAPNSPYSASKAASNHLVRAYYHTYGLPVTTSNCSNNYGMFQHAEKFIPTVMHACKQQNTIPVYGKGENIRDWLHVEDHCTAIDSILHKGMPGEVYNVGADNEWKNIDLVKLVCRLFDEAKPSHAPHDRLISFVEDRLGHDMRYSVNATKVLALDWKPTHNFIQEIRFLIEEALRC